ncbi:MAG TPA: hypothetical protein PK299_05070 [Anaerolineales bacterium]|nr:hypothetical protein [Anaerolineales bacterium]
MRSDRLSLIIAITVCTVVLAGAFLGGFVPVLADLKAVFTRWAAILAGVALLVAVLNLIKTHIQRIMKSEKGTVQSTILVFSFTFVVTVGLLGWFSPTTAQQATDAVTNPFITAQKAFTGTFQYLQLQIEAWLSALLAIFLLSAGLRWLRKNPSLASFLFILASIVFLLGLVQLNLPDLPAALMPLVTLPTVLRQWLMDVPVLAAVRGIWLGLALASLTLGVRVLLGVDRPYGGD